MCQTQHQDCSIFFLEYCVKSGLNLKNGIDGHCYGRFTSLFIVPYRIPAESLAEETFGTARVCTHVVH